MQLNQAPDGSYHPGRLKPEPAAPTGKEAIQIQTVKLLNSSWKMVQLRDFVYDALDALVTDLQGQAGMVGDDEAGAAFAKVYKSAVGAIVDKLDFASLVVSNGGGALLETAEEFLKTENKIAAELLKATDSPYNGVAPQPARPDCSPRPARGGEELPEVIGETGSVDQFLFSDRFRGDAGKLRDIAGKWYTARGLLADAFYGARDCWREANLDAKGLSADAVEKFFARFVGKGMDPPDQVSEDEALLPTLPAACFVLGKACDAYADHIDSSREQEIKDRDPLTGKGQWPWENPRFGGNGLDGGLRDKVASDPAIAHAGKIAEALGVAKERVKVPQPEGRGGIPGVPGWLPPLLRAPLRAPIAIPVAYRPRDPHSPNLPPIAPPNPPDPRFPPLTPAESGNFSTWINSLREGDISGGRPPEIAYQKRISGYPEYEVPIPKGYGANDTLMVDGFRRSDGMAVEAKYVKKPDQPCYRSLDALRDNHQTGQRNFLYKDDRLEMKKYAAALQDPRNKEMRGVETVTNNRDSVAYWRVMMAAYGVKGYARYAP
ncbi:hypothetical protein DQ392_33050 [Streptomyces reniochalinae]|uniref:Tox-REase-2 domain-containing protein n=2 Tax=Streptomyces reniochalinae TaxID=2250578 RepID=A0A367E5T1_9ACTN|nr:hypothetical protein DQ392_33050 [Streptomyces reniochalinae]